MANDLSDWTSTVGVNCWLNIDLMLHRLMRVCYTAGLTVYQMISNRQSTGWHKETMDHQTQLSCSLDHLHTDLNYSPSLLFRTNLERYQDHSLVVYLYLILDVQVYLFELT